jgi:hypothetical protein
VKRLIARVPLTTAALALYLLSVQVMEGTHRVYAVVPSAAFGLFRLVAFIWWLGWWWEEDRRRLGDAAPLDMGFFLAGAWPIIVPYRLFRTRGRRAFRGLLAFGGIYLAARLIGALG